MHRTNALRAATRVLVAALLAVFVVVHPNPQFDDVNVLRNAQKLLKKLDAELTKWNNKQVLAEWDYASNLTDYNLEKKLNLSVTMTSVLKRISQEALNFPWTNIKDENIRRQFQKLSTLGAPMQKCRRSSRRRLARCKISIAP